MRFGRGRESSNVEDRRGRRMPVGGKSLGIGTIVLALVAMYFGVDPGVVLNSGLVGGPPAAVEQAGPSPADDETARFVSMVLADTEDTWQALFQQGGRAYQEPKLVLYTGVTPTACGTGQAAMGPFYCPGDQKVYLDLSFFSDLKQRFQAPGDFAQAYVIAHEIGHHVQNLLGISDKVQAARQRVGEAEGNRLSVKLELQADCLAGVWAHHAHASRQVLESGDVEEAMAAASAIGDDRLQKQAQGYAVPDSFTHGSSDQRMRWFRVGLDRGRVSSCDTFSSASL